jgi:hypothetical protein
MLQSGNELEGMKRDHTIIMIGRQQQSSRILKQRKITLYIPTPNHCIKTRYVTSLHTIPYQCIGIPYYNIRTDRNCMPLLPTE